VIAFPSPLAPPVSKEVDRIAVVLNGNARSVNDEVIGRITRNLKNGVVFTSHKLEEAPAIAKKIVEGGFGVVLTGGGDGTFTIMATEVCKAADEAEVLAPRFGLLKLGTGNALVWVAGASPLADEEPPPFADIIRKDVPQQKLRLIKVDGVHSPFAGLGADAQILADYNATRSQFEGTPLRALGRGLTGYSVAALSRSLPQLLVQKMPRIRVINEGDDAWPVDPAGTHREHAIRKGETIYEGRARMAAFSTIPYYGFGMRLFPFADPASRRMHLRVSRLGSPQFLAHFRGIWHGTYHDPKYMNDFLVEKFRIECEEPVHFQIGGDSQGMRTEVSAETTSRTLRLIDFNQL
jgi:diacylglycerol kinase family enzyme